MMKQKKRYNFVAIQNCIKFHPSQNNYIFNFCSKKNLIINGGPLAPNIKREDIFDRSEYTHTHKHT